MNLQSKFLQDNSGNKYAPITTPNAVRWPDGSNLNDKLSAFDSVVIVAPVDNLDPTDKAAISQLSTVEAVEAYDYPTKPSF